MFALKKLHPPFGTRDAPVHEASYSEGIIPVVDGLCTVKNRDSRDYLLKMGYVDAAQESKPAAVAVVEHQAESKLEPKRGVVGKVLSRLKRKRRR